MRARPLGCVLINRGELGFSMQSARAFAGRADYFGGILIRLQSVRSILAFFCPTGGTGTT